MRVFVRNSLLYNPCTRIHKLCHGCPMIKSNCFAKNLAPYSLETASKRPTSSQRSTTLMFLLKILKAQPLKTKRMIQPWVDLPIVLRLSTLTSLELPIKRKGHYTRLKEHPHHLLISLLQGSCRTQSFTTSKNRSTAGRNVYGSTFLLSYSVRSACGLLQL